MYFIVQQLLSLIKLLHSDHSDSKIALALVLGLFSAVTPLSSLQGVFLVLLAVIFRFQLGAFLLSWLMLSILTLPFAGLFHKIGDAFLNLEVLNTLFISVQKNDFLSLTRFNNTIVMGGFLCVLLISPLAYFAFKMILKKYRDIFLGYIQNTKVYYFLKSTVFVKVYELYGKYGHA